MSTDEQHEQATEFRQHRFRVPDGATDMLLFRHGESAPARLDAPAPTVDGQADPELDPRGRQEAELVADRFADEEISAIYVTTLRRTAQTAEPLARRTGLTPHVEPDLREVHLGDWEGAEFRQRIAQGDPLTRRMGREQRWDILPGAEPAEALHKRIRLAIERIAAAHRDQRVAVFTHGGIMGTIVQLATGCTPFAFLGADNGSLTHLVVTDEHWIVRRFNDTGHLHTDLDRPVQPLI
ncbi:histidine phosphatase family protein [soil metagenome]